MSKNAYGGVTHRGVTKEWGSKSRKEDTRLRGVKHSAEREAVKEQVCDCEWNQSDDALVAQYGCGCFDG